jgi:putative SOS response-associated peptidase YedK
MCGRFTQDFTWTEILEFFKLIDEIAPALGASWNIAPTHEAGVIVCSESGLRFQPMRWGLVPFWAKDRSIGSKLINARAETLQEKPAFRHALKSRRCIVPVSGFYEWQRQGRSKQPYFVTSADERPLMLAGLWEHWNELLTFTIITVPSNAAIAAIHDRMPAILPGEDALAWLKTGDTALLRPCAPELLRFWPVSTRVNSPANNDPRLTEQVVLAAAEPPGTEDAATDQPKQFALGI